MPEIYEYRSIPNYSSVSALTVTLDTASILTEFGRDYHHIDLKNAAAETVQTETTTEFVVDVDAIYYSGDEGSWVFGYVLYNQYEEEDPIESYYSTATPAAIGVSLSSVERVVVVPLQGGGKTMVPIQRSVYGEPVVVIPIEGGGKATTKLCKLYAGEPCVVVQLQGGEKIPIPLVKKYIGSVYIVNRFTGLTPGATSQIRFNIKRTGSVQSYYPSIFFFGPAWYYGQAYDGHYSTEYRTEMNGSLLSTTYAELTTPEFICPTNGGININFEFYLLDVPGVGPLPIYINDVQILVGETWTDVPDGNFSAGEWNPDGYTYDSPMGTYWQKVSSSNADAIYQAIEGEGCKFFIITL